MDSKTKEYLSDVAKDPSVAKLVEDYLRIHNPYEQCVLDEVNPKIQQFILRWEKWVEAIEQQRDKEEVIRATDSLQYI